jgi:hypothetical protein
VEFGEVDREFKGRIEASMVRLGLTPQDCVLILDFAGADFGDAEAVATITQDALEKAQTIGLWQHVVFQGTNYPEKNPAGDNSSVTVPRNEWLAWRAAIQSDTDSSNRLIFGDYCADCAKFQFRSGGGAAPIRHYRYCTPDSWLVVRGKADGEVEPAMRNVCRAILDSGQFAGREFSSADEYIYGTAMGYAGPGYATKWREINTTHHITQVVTDVGRIRGYRVVQQTIEDRPEQIPLFVSSVR